MRPRFLGLVVLFIVGLALAALPVLAQGQTLPLTADLFLLTEEGTVMRIEAGGTFATAVTPPEQRVIDFGPAPDGRWVAYRTAPSEASDAFIAITAIDGLSGMILEFEAADQPPITGRGQTLAWSPDGAAIAYTTPEGLRVYLAGAGEFGEPAFIALPGGPFLNLVWSPGGGYLAAEAENDAWWIYRREGANVVYAGQIPASAGLAWTGEGVAALAPPTGGLIALDVTTGTQTTLVGAETLVSEPAVVDGERVLFLVHESTGQRFAARRFGSVSLNGEGLQVVEAGLELTGAMRWLPAGVGLTTTIDGALTVLEPTTNARREVMGGVKAYHWGPLPLTEVAGLALPADLYFLGRDSAGITQLWVLAADSSPARQLTLEPRSVLDFSIAPDGTRMAYTSGGSLKVAAIDGSGVQELSPVVERPGAGAQPAWSPDGQLIAFVRDGIWLVPSGGGGRTELVTDNFDENTPPNEIRVYLNPRWSPDGTMLLLDIGYYEGRGLALLPITGGEPLPLPTLATQGGWMPDGRVLVWDYGMAFTEPGLYLVDPANLETYTTILDSTWHVADAVPLTSEAIRILRTAGGEAMGPGTAQPFLVSALEGAQPVANGQGGLLEEPLLSPDGRFAAGLRARQYGDYGPAGRLVVINLTTGERVAVETAGDVWALQWGGTP